MSLEYSAKPDVLAIADSPAGKLRAREIITLLGARSDTVHPIEDAIERLDLHVGADAVLLDLSEDRGALFDSLLDRLEVAARVRRRPSVVILPRDLIDIAAARAPHPAVALLFDPDASDILAALSIAIARGELQLQDVGDNRAQQLGALSQEVGRIAQILARLSVEESQRPASGLHGPHGAIDGGEGGRVDPGAVRAIIRVRRMRDQFFANDLFADPAWDMLLDLTAARLEEQPVAVSSLCIAAAVPPTTALRWIKTLADAGLFVRTADPRDKRRVFIDLSDEAAHAMTAYLLAIQRAGVHLTSRPLRD